MRSYSLLLVPFAFLVFIVGITGIVKRFNSSQQNSTTPGLDSPDGMTIFSIETCRNEYKKENDKLFHGYRILGSIEIIDAEKRSVISSAFRNSLTKHGEIYYSCFTPHHGLRVIEKGVVYDYIICFYCSEVRVIGPKYLEPLAVKYSFQKMLNTELKTAGVPLSEQITEQD